MKRILLLLVVVAALARVHAIERHWSYGDHDGWGGAFYSNIARNYLRYGYLATGFAPITSTGNVPVEKWRYYLSHPPLIGLFVSLSFLVFGEHEWSARIVPLVFSLGSILLIFRLASGLWSNRTAIVAAAIFAFVPMEVVYATHVDPQGPPVTFAALLLLIAYQERRPLLAVAAFVLGAGFDWPIHYMTGLIAVHALVFEHEKRRWVLALPAASLVFVLGFLVYSQRVASNPEQHAIQSSTDSFLFWSGIRVTRNHIPGHRMVAPDPVAWVGKESSYFRELYGLPLLVLSLVGVAAAGGRLQRSYLLLALLWGMAHVVLFPIGAFVHDYWMTYLAPGLALAGGRAIVWTAQLLPDSARRLRTAAILAATVALSVSSVARGIDRIETSRADPASFGMRLHRLVGPNDGILSVSPFDARDAYYAGCRIRDQVNSVSLFEKALDESPGYRYFVVPQSTYAAHPHKPLFESLGSCHDRLAFDGYYVFDLARCRDR
ncbi:MAG TPA: glycosyltransferase family 39 protein [Vicinamibacteria bacterium]|nr:glycosyltransferase family 39 protein [Vicinamibacteria bacterium]